MRDQLNPYLLMWSATKFWLVGPFANYEDSCDYGRKWQHTNGDDPRWNTISLASVPAGVQVILP